MTSSLANLPAPTNYLAYTRAVASIPSLSEAEEKRLSRLWKEKGSKEAAQQLVLSQLHLVVKIVKDHEGYGLNKADLAQEGTVGLMKAVHKFDPSKGVRLGTYAWYWIEAEVKEFILKNWRLVSWGTSSLAKKMFFGYRKTVQRLKNIGEEREVPSADAISQSLGISVEDAQMAQAYFMGSDIELDYEDDEEKMFPAVSYQDPLVSLEKDEKNLQLQWMKNEIGKLPERERDIVRARFLQTPPETLQKLAIKQGVSVERVRQIEKQAIDRLKKSSRLIGVS